jgi:hypothetical protein
MVDLRRNAQRFRAHARNCRKLATEAERPAEREILLQLADHWDAIAELVDRHRPPDVR